MAVSHLDATLSGKDQTPRLWTQLIITRRSIIRADWGARATRRDQRRARFRLGRDAPTRCVPLCTVTLMVALSRLFTWDGT
jgi:hypothetical protein